MSVTKKVPSSKLPSSISVLGGVIILFFGLNSLVWHTGFYEFMPQMGMGSLFDADVVIISMIATVSGGIVIIAGILMHKIPQKIRIFGIIVFVFSFLSCVGMGIFIFGGLVGITGGVFAILPKK